MRRGQVLFILGFVLFVGFALHEFSTLISLLFEKGTRDAIHLDELPGLDGQPADTRPALIPKIIHQTYVNTTIPEQWKEGQQSCIDLHPDYEYKLWTDELSRQFIATEYPWFLPDFDAYSYPIQRADAIRYFVLSHYGGIYLDLDDGCARRLDPLLAYPAWVRITIPTGISNDAMGSAPGHPFFATVVQSLRRYRRDWKVPYISVMYSTGPLFLSVVWKEYISGSRRGGAAQVRLLMPDEYSKKPWAFFKIAKGSSWHGEDARAIFWMGRYWWLLTMAGFALAGVIGGGLWWACFHKRSQVMGTGKRARRCGRSWGWRSSSSTKGEYEAIDHLA